MTSDSARRRAHPEAVLPSPPPAAGGPANRWATLPTAHRVGLAAGAAALGSALLCCGAAVVGTHAPPDGVRPAADTARSTASPADSAATGSPVTGSPTLPADLAATDSSAASAAGSPPAGTTATPGALAARTSTRLVSRVRAVPYARRTVRDATLASGTTRLRTRGVAGRERLTHRVTYAGGAATGRALVRRVLLRAPVAESPPSARARPCGRPATPGTAAASPSPATSTARAARATARRTCAGRCGCGAATRTASTTTATASAASEPAPAPAGCAYGRVIRLSGGSHDRTRRRRLAATH
ncbi:hypothetical protein GCM10010123_03340 [Pilimelia anulata]|uniref:G5 domain-containing protein n=1 Tax=Pilimelia anulata TaxID=53371 RepID=A0A8J3B6E2_9ACTN|nr:hypothetical protein GCM10010123_03340 [Pilimelia anulata]